MALLTNILFFIAALILLIKGADWVTRYASRLVLRWGVSEFAIGATIVAVATSLPEIFVSLLSAVSSSLNPASGAIDIASGTVIGSNIANIGLILGLAILLRPLGDELEEITQENFMLLLTILVSGLLLLGLGMWGGTVLLGVTFVYVFYLMGRTRSYNPATLLRGAYYKVFTRESSRDLLLSFLGGAVLGVGAVLLVNSVVGISAELAIPQFLIAILVVAVGTSLPELSASITAALKGMKKLSVGNIIGSNIINICALGMAALISPIAATQKMLMLDIPALLLISVLVLVFLKAKRGLTRWMGLTFLVIYAAFVALQFI